MFRCIKFGCIAIGKDVKKEEALMRVGGGGLIPNSMICRHCHSDMEEIVDPSDRDPIPNHLATIGAIHTAAEVSAEIEDGLMAEDGSALKDGFMGDMFGLHDGIGEGLKESIDNDIMKDVAYDADMVEKCIAAGKILDAQPLPDGYMSEVLEWTRVRDGIDDAVIALRGYCDELGATHMEDKVQYIYRKLQDIAYTKFNMGD